MGYISDWKKPQAIGLFWAMPNFSVRVIIDLIDDSRVGNACLE